MTTLIVFFGVEKGIEKVSKLMMPILVILTIGIAIYTIVTLDGAWAGVIYYIKPDFSHFSLMTVVSAMGQLFYSMSLAMGIMITFGSYMKKEINIETSIHQIEFFDMGIAFLAGLMIIPAVFAFSGGDESALGQGPGLMFSTLPKIFDTMPGGAVLGTAFFIMVFFAALTSAISLMETVVSIFMDKLKWNRRPCCLLALAISLLLGLPSSLGYSAWSEVKVLGMQFLDLFDFVSNSVLMPIVAFCTCLFVGFFLSPRAIAEEIELSGRFRGKRLFSVMIRYIAPLCILLILLSSVLNAFGVIKI
jgi:NSS family neurotransmitter:Na+ symporter